MERDNKKEEELEIKDSEETGVEEETATEEVKEESKVEEERSLAYPKEELVEPAEDKREVEPARKKMFELGLMIGIVVVLVSTILLILFNPQLIGKGGKETKEGYSNDKPYMVGQYPQVEVKEGTIEMYSAELRKLLEGDTKKFKEADYINIAFQSDLEYLTEEIAKNYFMDYSLMKDKKCEIVSDCLVYDETERLALIEDYSKKIREVFAYIDSNVEYKAKGEDEEYNDYLGESLARKEKIVEKLTLYVEGLNYATRNETMETFLYMVSVGKGDILTDLDGFATMVKERVGK